MKTINDIIFRVYRNPILQNVSKSDIVTHVKEVMGLLDVPAAMEEKRIVLNVLNYRVVVPSDLHIIKAVSALDFNSREVRLHHSSDDRILHQHERRDPQPSTVTYKHVPGFIYTDFESGDIEVIYTAFSTDPDGFPLIPDEPSLMIAIENYIKVQHFTILADMGMVTEQTLHRAETQYAWSIGQASNKFTIPTPEEAETLFNAIARLLPDRQAIDTNFKYNAVPQNLRNHD